MTINPTSDAAKLLPCPLSDDQIRYMVDRFLGWRLPKPWTPDNGISYQRPNYAHAPADHDWPTGTNLFDWSQVEAMVRYMIEGMPGLAARPKVEDAEVAESMRLMRAREVGVSAYGSALEIAPDRDCHKAADLLERLAGERDELRRALSREQTSGVARVAFDQICQERDGLEVKLAECEAELQAYRDAAIYDLLMDGPQFKTWNRSQLDRARGITERHAARQAQASAERDGETR